MSTSIREQIAEKFKDKEYRDAFVAEQIYSRLPLKIRTLREDRELTQTELGEKAGMAQAWVSKLEDPSYGKLTITTLLKVASACDVALSVDFVPYSHILDRATNSDGESFSVPSYDQDAALSPVVAAPMNVFATAVTPPIDTWQYVFDESPLFLRAAHHQFVGSARLYPESVNQPDLSGVWVTPVVGSADLTWGNRVEPVVPSNYIQYAGTTTNIALANYSDPDITYQTQEIILKNSTVKDSRLAA